MTAVKSQQVKNKVKKLPDSPGVYLFKKKGKILYVGKATSLRDRVRSYFSSKILETRGPLIERMLGEFDKIDYIKTDSVLEALILEASLIKKYQSEANVKEKDDRSFNFVVITDEDFPRVLVMRGKEIEKFLIGTSFENHGNFLLKISSVRRRRSSRGFSQEDASKNFSILQIFGPFPNGGQLKEAIKIVRKIFPFRDKCIPFFPPSPSERGQGVRPRPCFNRQIGLCPGVCTGEISKKNYAKQIKNIILFFEGKKKMLVKNLEKQMKGFAKTREFESADKIKRTIFALNHIRDVALIKEEKVSKSDFDTFGFRIEGYDVAHISGTDMVGVMVVVENGEAKKSDYRKFSARGGSAFGGRTVLGDSGIINDTKALSEILSRRLAHKEWPLPSLIVVDGGLAQKRAAEKILKENKMSIPVVSVVKDERHKPRKIIGLNNPAFATTFAPNSAKATLGRQGLGGSKKATAGEGEILLANAEAHRFAIGFHRRLRYAKMRI